jgi:hypothetical protein
MSKEGPLLNWTEVSRPDQPVDKWERGDIIIDATNEIPQEGYLVSALERCENGNKYLLLDENMDYEMYVSKSDNVQWAIERIADRVNRNKYNRHSNESYNCKGEQSELSKYVG